MDHPVDPLRGFTKIFENFAQICIFEYADQCELICFGQKKQKISFLTGEILNFAQNDVWALVPSETN